MDVCGYFWVTEPLEKNRGLSADMGLARLRRKRRAKWGGSVEGRTGVARSTCF